MSQQQPQFYEQLAGMLTPEEQQVIKSALEQADKIQQQAASGQAAAAGSSQSNGTS